jgi:hypothetical protein
MRAQGRRRGLNPQKFHPYSPLNMLLRLPLAAIGAFIGATAGLSLALVAGALLYAVGLDVVRPLTMTSAVVGLGGGFVVANILATSLLRERSRAGGPAIPTARLLGARSGQRSSASRSSWGDSARPAIRPSRCPPRASAPAP